MVDTWSTKLNASLSRDQRKYPRHRVFKEAKIDSPAFNGTINVTIRELSVGGARIDTPPHVEIPKEFDLLVVSENLLYPAVARWCAGVSAGIEFAGKPHRPKVLPFSKPLQQ
jgi:hypothetical protein